MLQKFLKLFLAFSFLTSEMAFAQNQTADITPILPSDSLPFQISIELADFSLPNGLQGYVTGIYKGYWLLLAGRTNGVHGFSSGNDNFPPLEQNTVVYVVNTLTGAVSSKSLHDPSSGLTQTQIDSLSVTAAEGYQNVNTLYVAGGYGVDTSTGQFNTKDALTAVDIPGLIHWVITPSPGETASQYIRQTFHPFVQVTGGYLSQVNPHGDYLLVFGQNFTGFYSDSSNGNYTQQVRSFRIIDNGKQFYIQPKLSSNINPSYRRRDLNVVPIIQKIGTNYRSALVALSGVFTLDTGVWTVPVTINADGSSFMADPNNPNTFKQGMNNYYSAYISLFSKKTKDTFIILLGGLSYGYFQSGVFITNPEIPFTNQVTTIKIDQKGNFSQHIMNNQYPVILSTGSNPGNQLYFGASCKFYPVSSLPRYPNDVFQYEKLGNKPILIGYIVGGIQSTVLNTNFITDSTASPYIFKVFLQPK